MERVAFTTNHFNVSLVGLSRDLATNRWSVTCKKCGGNCSPKTTMYRWQTVECTTCGHEECLDYNDLKAVPTVVARIKGTDINVKF